MINLKELYPKTYSTMEKYGKLAVDNIKDILTKEGKDTTGELISSVNYKIVTNNNDLELLIGWIKYGDYVDKGRKPGKMPPVSKIEQWVKLKSIQGRDKKGRFIKSSQTAFAIAKSIEKEGIEPTFFSTLTERNVFKNYEVDITKALEQDIQDNLNKL